MSEPSSPLADTREAAHIRPIWLVRKSRERRYWLNVVLLLATVVTTVIVGAHLQYNFNHNRPAFGTETYTLPLSSHLARTVFHDSGPIEIELPFPMKWVIANPGQLLLGIPFAIMLMGILLAHELGHFLYCEHYGVYATLPYFLPGPFVSPIGTFGAVIRIKSPIRSRQALFDIGIAGPIAGFVLGVPVLLCGLALSKPLTPQAAGSLISFGYPPIFYFSHGLVKVLLPHTPALGAMYLHPIAVAAWVGMLATSLNLLPGGQLDGGHIVYAVEPRAHRWATWTTVTVLTLLSFHWPGWLLWAVILAITGWRHPPVPPWPHLSGGRRAMSLVAVAILALTWVPAPIVGVGW